MQSGQEGGIMGDILKMREFRKSLEQDLRYAEYVAYDLGGDNWLSAVDETEAMIKRLDSAIARAESANNEALYWESVEMGVM